MQHVKVLIQNASTQNNSSDFHTLENKLYALNQHIDHFILGVSLQPNEILFLTPKDRFLPQGEQNYDLLDSVFKIMNELEINAAINKLKDSYDFRNAAFYKYRISGHTPIATPHTHNHNGVTDHMIYFVIEQ